MPLCYPATLQIARPLNTSLPGGWPTSSERVAGLLRDAGRLGPKYALSFLLAYWRSLLVEIRTFFHENPDTKV